MSEQKNTETKTKKKRGAPLKDKLEKAGLQTLCVRLPDRLIKEADTLRRLVAKRTPYCLEPSRSDVVRVALSLGFEQIKKETK